jgi:hypothetical protein
MQNDVSRLGRTLRPDCQPARALTTHPEHTLVITSFKRLIAALAFIVPAAALVTSPVMAASHTKTAKTHHASVHKASAHKMTHAKKTTAPSAS